MFLQSIPFILIARVMARAVGGCLAVLTLAFFLVPSLPIWQGGEGILFAAAAPWLGGVLLLAMGVAWILTLSITRGLLAGAWIVWAVSYAPLSLPRITLPPPSTAQPLRVVSYSLWYHNPHPDSEELIPILRDQNPDILLLQEVSSERWQAMLPSLRAHWQGDFYAVALTDKSLLQVVVSRYPIELMGAESEQTRLVQTRVTTPFGNVHVWNMHAFRPEILPAFSYSSDFADKHAMARSQFDWLQQQIARIHEPLILAGDFNQPFLSPAYRQITQHLVDAHWEAGDGWGFTYPSTPVGGRVRVAGWDFFLSWGYPMVAIDHVFHSTHFWTDSARVLSDVGSSDHAPILADLRLIP